MAQATPTERIKITGRVAIPPALTEEIASTVHNVTQFQARLEKAKTKGVTEITAVLLLSALALNASDIHLEPKRTTTKVRLRVDGMLQDVSEFKPAIYETLLSRIKLVSRMKLNVTKKPQDGRFSFALPDGAIVETRVATLPSEHGESIVLRILNPKSLIAIEELGLRSDLLQVFKRALKKPNGLILATGPTGSGKTTTLYAFLKNIQRPEIKIITIEDPIEYHLEGISQTQVYPNQGYDFATGLQALMRQDPDVILVGEIRNKDTARITLQAALTGHVVLSTLHTNDAAGTLSRLVSLKTKRMNISTAINLIIGQRLARKVCTKCAVHAQATTQEFEKLTKSLEAVKPGIKPKFTSALKLAKAKGCQDCNNTGYKGRVGIFEAIIIDQELEAFILEKPSTSAFRNAAIKKGMIPMYQDGFIKVIQKVTTIEEIERVTGE